MINFITKSSKHFFVIFGIIVFLPSLVFILFNQSSYSSGMVILSLTIITYIKFKTQKLYLFPFYNTITYFISYLLIHTIILKFMQINIDYYRLIGSVIVFFVMLLAAFNIVLFFNRATNENAMYVLKIFYFIFYCLIVLAGIFGFVPPIAQYLIFSKPIFPFLEPSHFAIFFAPYFLWMIYKRKKLSSKVLFVVSIIIVLGFISNLTLACVVGLCIILTFGLRKSVFILPLIGLVILVSNIDVEYYTKRSDLTANNNLSTLVWLQGWEEAYLHLNSTYGVGIGLSQLGVEEPKGDAAITIQNMTGDFMNRNDGGTFGAKLVSEFGIFGLVLILWILKKNYISFVFLRKHRFFNSGIPAQLIFYHCSVFYFIIELFVRSTSYLAPGFFIFMVGVIGIKLSKTKKRSNFTIKE